jgi:alkaline phosphatase D
MTDKPQAARLDDRSSLTLSRREFVGFIGATLAASACGGLEQEQAPPAPLLAANPFSLGVASGDPLSTSVVLWTRLAPEPIAGGGMPDEPIPVIWEVSRESDFYGIEAYGWAWADPDFAHSVHVDVDGLEPDTWYYYRFRVGAQWTSPTGRTRTFPRSGESPVRLRLATASCQNWRHGYYSAYRHLAAEEIDLVAFLGDYIYESGVQGPVRDHDGPRPKDLDGFRNRYGLYKSDPDLQAAHARCPWIFTWDDHEVKNNYADLDIPGVSVDEAKALRAAAYQAYYEHMPLRIPAPDEPADMQIYRRLQFGDLVSFHVLDGRQYRTDQPCNDDAGLACGEEKDEANTMLGAEQRAWLEGGLRASKTTWNSIVQQTVFASLNLGGGVLNPDQWDGYTVERQRLLSVFAEEGVRNVVVHTGDIHAAIFATLHRDANDFDSEVVGVECVTTSISSNGLSESRMPSDLIRRVMNNQKNIGYFDPDRRGYCVCEYTPEKFTVEYKSVSTVESREAELSVDGVFEVKRD